MISNEVPVLRREDLVTILEALFKFSQESNNALIHKQDGLYVFDFYNQFTAHANDSTIHPTTQETAILHNFSIEDDILCYRGEPIIIKVSNTEGNAIQIRSDGLYISDLSEVLSNHIGNNEKHITDEERTKWNGILNLAKEYTRLLVDAIVTYDFQFVNELPTEENLIDSHTVYCVQQQMQDSGETFCSRYVYRNHNWIPFDITLNTYNLFARKTEVDNTYLKKNDTQVHSHTNKDVLDKFSEGNNNNLLYNGYNILDAIQISDDPDNALFTGSDHKLYVKDLSSELESIARQASLSKVVLYNGECDHAGSDYILEEYIDDFNFIILYYYVKPDDPTLAPYDAKSEMIDSDMLLDLYDRNIDYILEHDYGISTYNSKIRFYRETIIENDQEVELQKLQVTYYNHVCIYKIIGVR